MWLSKNLLAIKIELKLQRDGTLREVGGFAGHKCYCCSDLEKSSQKFTFDAFSDCVWCIFWDFRAERWLKPTGHGQVPASCVLLIY